MGDGTYSYVINDTGFTKEAKACMLCWLRGFVYLFSSTLVDPVVEITHTRTSTHTNMLLSQSERLRNEDVP